MVFELTSLGIVQGDENGNMHVDDYITRAEFSKVLINLMGYDGAPAGDSVKTVFSDVATDDFYAEYISFAYSAGILNGYPDGTFRPNDNVLLQDGIKSIVTALGYEAAAAQNGGYPSGYLNIAYTLNLTKGIDGNVSSPAARGDIITVIYNALDQKMLQKVYGSGDYELSDETLRDRLTDRFEKYSLSGVVTANHDVWLVNPISSLKENEVEIDGVIFDQGNTNTAQYLGYTVEIYYRENPQTGKWEIINAAPTSKNEVFVLEAEDYTGFSNNRITYEKNDSGKKEHIDLADERMILYNNRLLTSFQNSDMDIEYGSYTCIDNNGDNLYDYVFINEYQSSVVEKVFSNGNIYYKNALLIDGKRYIALSEDLDVTYTIYDAERNKISINDVKKDDVISVFKSRDGLYIDITVSEKTASGQIEKTDEEGIYIGGEYYLFGNEYCEKNAVVGEFVKAYINHENRVVFLENDSGEESSVNYGYIFETGSSDGFGTYEVKIIKPSFIEEEQEENEENKDDKNTIPVLVCRNGGVEIYTLSEKLRFNGSSISPSSLAGRIDNYVPVEYKLDSEGKVKSIDTMPTEYGSTGVKMKYNAYDKTFGGISGIMPFAVDEKTKVICIPTNPDAGDDDIMTQIRIDNKEADVRYLAGGYDYDENEKTVRLLVVAQEMDADTSLNITAGSKIGLVSEFAVSSSEDGDIIYRMQVLTGGESETYICKSENAGKGDILKLKKGDLIFFEKNNDGYLVNAEIIKSLSSETEAKENEKGKLKDTVFGYVQDISFNDIDASENMKIHTLQLLIDSGKTVTVTVPARNGPDIYIYNRASKTARAGVFEDLRPYNGSAASSDMICIARPNGGTAKVCVIVR